MKKEEVVDFAFRFIAQTSNLWKQANLTNRQKFQKMIFPEEIPYNFENGFGTTKKGHIFDELETLTDMIEMAATKKKTHRNDESPLVNLTPSVFNLIVAEVVRWNDTIRNLSSQPHPLMAIPVV